ncbi:unnamed protein product [Paramecium pentaurelia]|uniref:Uncharacterized protein n=1 Tax=Paramecium pentaurelia TaxID=43138 RepID=A0A8S1YLJ6_9CILI|nr:unnamed protein product [Paramecium pentaurelia]
MSNNLSCQEKIQFLQQIKLVDTCIPQYEFSNLSGTQFICLRYPGYCSNSSTATDTTPRVQRKFSDNTEESDNATCASFLPGCISIGKDCFDFTIPSTLMKETQETCDKIFACTTESIDNFTTNQYYNSSTAPENDYCSIKICKLPEKENDGTFGFFQRDVPIMEIGDLLIQKLMKQLVQVVQVLLYFVNLLLLVVILSNCVLEQLHQLHAQLELVQIIWLQQKMKILSLSCHIVQLNLMEVVLINIQESYSQQNGTVFYFPNFNGSLLVSSVWTKVSCIKYDACQDRLCSDNNPLAIFKQQQIEHVQLYQQLVVIKN